MPSPPALASVADVVRGLFSWLADVAIERGVLAIRSATGRIDLAPDRQPATAGPGVVRVGDFVLRLALYPGTPGTAPSGGGPITGAVAPSLWVSFSPAEPYMWTQVATTAVTGPTSTDAGTPVTTTIGSTRVTCG